MATKTKKTTAATPTITYGLRHAETKLLVTALDTFTADPGEALRLQTLKEAEALRTEYTTDEEDSLFGEPIEVVNLAEYVAPGVPTDTEHVVADDAPAVQGELLPADAGTATPPVVTGTLVLSSPGGALMTATALKAHAADLKKLAKGARDLSQHKEALTFEQNATMIEETLLTQLEPQAKLPFGYADVKKALGDRIAGKLRAQLVTAIKRDTPIIEGDTSGKERNAQIEQRIDDFEALVGNVASVVTALVEPVIAQAAEKGMLAGRLARETTADVLALEAVEAVSNA